jgi:hypothetical protein
MQDDIAGSPFLGLKWQVRFGKIMGGESAPREAAEDKFLFRRI